MGMEYTKKGEDAEGANTNQRVVHLQQWMSALSERKKGKGSILYIHGIHNTAGGEELLNRKDPQKCENNFVSCQTKGIIYERLCLGVRYLEMVILEQCGTEEGTSDLLCACGDGCIYSASDLLEEVAVFFLSNKRERVVLSFLLRAGGGHDDGDNGHEDSDNDDHKTTHLLDVYMYLYLRRHIKQAEGDEKCRVLYFLNDRERFLNLAKYQHDIDHFAIRNWVFNNMSLLLSSKMVHSGGRSSDGGDTFLLEGKDSVNSPRETWRVCPKDEGKETNALTPFCNTINRNENTLLSLPQQHHMSLFRLNSMHNDQVPILSSKVCVKKKFPNILITTQGDYHVADSKETDDSLLPSETAYRRNNAKRYYMQRERDHNHGGTLHSLNTHDSNLNWSGKFIGSNNLPLTDWYTSAKRESGLEGNIPSRRTLTIHTT
ncbi:hypothetical protein AK88_00402 [Plasmodium fragile]|uniref:Uncharacterized protein n=1 Tax=Plasmodium fragile TaxID=5857 RepID=A0A0D9QU81_PLAFR|nr:uncharacterized protein AK88_00402 [Plasmodium fragile]KJP89946.1 hypothetical protein AK88_00402 [Plasmodium fragile]